MWCLPPSVVAMTFTALHLVLLIMATDARQSKSEDTKSENSAPSWAFTVRGDHRYPIPYRAGVTVPLKQIPSVALPFLRYTNWYFQNLVFGGPRTFIDIFNLLHVKPHSGVPCGGIGSGSIGRSISGSFTRFQIIPGLTDFETIDADNFLLTVRDDSGTRFQSKLFPNLDSDSSSAPTSWEQRVEPREIQFQGLYPRAWYDIDLQKKAGLKLRHRQVSPVIPHNYKDTSYPVTALHWGIENTESETKVVSLTFTFSLLNQYTNEISATRLNEVFFRDEQNDRYTMGLSMQDQLARWNPETPLNYSFTIATSTDNTNAVSYDFFDPVGDDGLEIWNQLNREGRLRHSFPGRYDAQREDRDRGMALSVQVAVPGNSVKSLSFALVWDTPKFQFPDDHKKTVYRRRYTQWFPDDLTAGPCLAATAFNSVHQWELEIREWQDSIGQNDRIPTWLKSLLFNELYYLTEGGSIWIRSPIETKTKLSEHMSKWGHFWYLECLEYLMMNTVDVHFYASPLFISLWPELQKSIQYDTARAINMEDEEEFYFFFDGVSAPRKTKRTVPHDLGNPNEAVFSKVNAYRFHDTANWKDLPLKFVLQVYRDYLWTGDEDYLRSLYPNVKDLMSLALQWDSDGDGLIENMGFPPDQTYDSWVMEGPSAYTCGLWLAALHAAKKMAAIMEGDKVDYWQGKLDQAVDSYERRLWTGSHYAFDLHRPSVVMADHLVGAFWLSHAENSTDDQPFNRQRIKTALQTIYQYNVLSFKGGNAGAINGYVLDETSYTSSWSWLTNWISASEDIDSEGGAADQSSFQALEVWTGVNYLLASAMIQEGMLDFGLRTAEGIYKTVWQESGLAFQTPEALNDNPGYRAPGYMRALSVWTLYLELTKQDTEATENVREEKGLRLHVVQGTHKNIVCKWSPPHPSSLPVPEARPLASSENLTSSGGYLRKRMKRGRRLTTTTPLLPPLSIKGGGR